VPPSWDAMMGMLEGKIALVTCSNGGIGPAAAKRFASECAHVFITGRRDRELFAAIKEIGKT
jgi:NAD(P)-dependent dehydrogenase (short-subunit alcohol dehydrogenase family)